MTGATDTELDRWDRFPGEAGVPNRLVAEVRTLRAEVERLEKAHAYSEAAVVLLTKRAEQAEAKLAEVMGALKRWEEAESAPDCVACAVLDASLPDPVSAAKEKK